MPTKATESPETLGYVRSPNSGDRTGTATGAPRSPAVPPYKGDCGRDHAQKPRPWLEEKINNSRRAARPNTCPRCTRTVLVGPDHDTVAATAKVDATPVAPLDEAVALLAGTATYSCDLVRGELHHREPHHLEAATQPHPIHLEHRCPPTAPEVLF